MSDRERLVLEQLAIEFLVGQLVREPGGWYARRFLAPDSDREREARTAFARLLRSDVPLNEELRYILADLFYPRDGPAHERQLVFKNRFPGKSPEWQRDIQIAGHVFYQVKDGTKVDVAIQDAMERFGVQRDRLSRVEDVEGAAFRKWKSRLPA
jgi:hypothetical protein